MRKIISFLLAAVMLCSLSAAAFADGDRLPAGMDSRLLSDAELSALVGAAPEKARAEISTVADAVAYLDLLFPTLRHSYEMWQGMDSNIAILRSGKNILSDFQRGNTDAGRSDMITAVTFLLADDADIKSIYGFYFDDMGNSYPAASVNCISADGKAYFFDPVLSMRGDSVSRRILLPETVTSGLEEYAELVKPGGQLSATVDVLYAITDGQQITFTESNEWTTVTSPAVAPFYSNESKHLTEEEYNERMYGHIIPENISLYKLPTMLGGLTMTVEDAKAIVGETPAVIREKVRTAGDLLLYMLASRMLLKNGDKSVTADGHDWHYNSTAEQVLAENLGNCGRMANLANYLLADDYEEIGFILHSYYPGNGSGHVYNYIRYGGKYYIVDFSSYLFADYSVQNEFHFLALNSLEEYGERWSECYGGLAAIIAHRSSARHLPNLWEGNGYIFPEGAEFEVLYETPLTGYAVKTTACPDWVTDWKKDQITADPMDSASDWSREALETALELGLIPEELQERYRDSTTRSEFCALGVRLYETIKGETIEGRSTFDDTDDENVEKMAALGVVSGVGGGKFDPDSTITREQAAIMLANLMKALGKELDASAPVFADGGEIHDWAAAQVGAVEAAGIMNGVGNERFDPLGSYTREQSIATMLRLFRMNA